MVTHMAGNNNYLISTAVVVVVVVVVVVGGGGGGGGRLDSRRVVPGETLAGTEIPEAGSRSVRHDAMSLPEWLLCRWLRSLLSLCAFCQSLVRPKGRLYLGRGHRVSVINTLVCFPRGTTPFPIMW